MTELNLPLHPSMRHPLTGQPVRALYIDKNGRARYPIMGGAPDDPADPPKQDDPPADPPKTDDPPKQDDDNGFPANTPVAQMSLEQQVAYHAFHSRKHEQRAKEYREAAGGKTAADVKKDLEEVETLRRKNLSDHERQVEDAKRETREQTAREVGLEAARMAFEFALGHDPENNDQSELIETLDLSKVLTDSGKVDAAKVRTIVGKIAPADKDKGGRQFDFGGGNRGGTKTKSGVSAGAELFDASRKKTTTSTS